MKGEALAITPFKREEAWILFTKLMKWDDTAVIDEKEIKAAEMLLSKIDGLALGIRQMVALIKVKDKGVLHFLNRYRKGRVKDDGSSKIDDYEFTLETIWRDIFTTLEAHAKKGGLGFDLLGIMTYLSPDHIPDDLFIRDEVTSVPHLLAFCKNKDKWEVSNLVWIYELTWASFDDATEELVEIALIDTTANHNAHYIHRLVQSAFDKFLNDKQRQEYFESAVFLTHRAFPQQVEGRPLHLQWKACDRYLQHNKKVAEFYRESQDTLRPLVVPVMLAESLKSCAW